MKVSLSLCAQYESMHVIPTVFTNGTAAHVHIDKRQPNDPLEG